MAKSRITLVIPAYNEAHRLPVFLSSLGDTFVPDTNSVIDIIVVDDGSESEHLLVHREVTSALHERFRSSGVQHSAQLVEQSPNRGKAAAIRLGWESSSAEAEWLGFVDADGAVPSYEVARIAAQCGSTPFDALLGSRIRMAGHRIERSLFRHLQGRVFATLAEQFLHLEVYDSQCGLKFFRAPMLRPRLQILQEGAWLLDVEVIAVLQRLGGRALEIPIDWADVADSKVRLGVDAVRMALGLWTLRNRLDRVLPPSSA